MGTENLDQKEVTTYVDDRTDHPGDHRSVDLHHRVRRSVEAVSCQHWWVQPDYAFNFLYCRECGENGWIV